MSMSIHLYSQTIASPKDLPEKDGAASRAWGRGGVFAAD
jgi:hypothetical protein